MRAIEYEKSSNGIGNFKTSLTVSTYLNHSDRARVSSSGTTKDETIALDMHVGKTIRHHENGGGISSLLSGFTLRCGNLVLGRVFGPTAWS